MYRKGLKGNAVQITAFLMGPRNRLWASSASCLQPHSQPQPALGLDRIQIRRKARIGERSRASGVWKVQEYKEKEVCGAHAGLHLTSRVLYRTLKGACWVLSGMVSCNQLLPASCLTVVVSPSPLPSPCSPPSVPCPHLLAGSPFTHLSTFICLLFRGAGERKV